MIIDLFFLANLTKSSNCCLVATAPVGLFGEQKKITSVRSNLERSGKNPFSGVQAIYVIREYLPSSWS